MKSLSFCRIVLRIMPSISLGDSNADLEGLPPKLPLGERPLVAACSASLAVWGDDRKLSCLLGGEPWAPRLDLPCSGEPMPSSPCGKKEDGDASRCIEKEEDESRCIDWDSTDSLRVSRRVMRASMERVKASILRAICASGLFFLPGLGAAAVFPLDRAEAPADPLPPPAFCSAAPVDRPSSLDSNGFLVLCRSPRLRRSRMRVSLPPAARADAARRSSLPTLPLPAAGISGHRAADGTPTDAYRAFGCPAWGAESGRVSCVDTDCAGFLSVVLAGRVDKACSGRPRGRSEFRDGGLVAGKFARKI